MHGRQVWSHVHVPNIKNLPNERLEKALNFFTNIGKLKVKPLYQRIKEHDKIQRSIDELALEMTGLDDWKDRLDKLYDAVANELETMQKILRAPKRERKARKN